MSPKTEAILAALRGHPFAELVVTRDPPTADLYDDGEFVAQGLAPARRWILTDAEAWWLIERGIADHVRERAP